MSDHVALDPAACGRARLAQIFDQAIAPRPLALVSALGEHGRPYLQPVSWYSSAAVNPPVQYLALQHEDAPLLDRLRRHGEFVLNSIDEDVARALPALEGTAEERDFLACGLLPRPSVKVAPYRVAESPAQIECRVVDVIPVADGAAHLVLGAVVQFHVRDDLHQNGRIDQRRYRAVGQLAEDFLCRCRELYRMSPGELA